MSYQIDRIDSIGVPNTKLHPSKLAKLLAGSIFVEKGTVDTTNQTPHTAGCCGVDYCYWCCGVCLWCMVLAECLTGKGVAAAAVLCRKTPRVCVRRAGRVHWAVDVCGERYGGCNI